MHWDSSHTPDSLGTLFRRSHQNKLFCHVHTEHSSDVPYGRKQLTSGAFLAARFCSFLLFILVPLIVLAQKRNIQFEHLSSEDGLSQNSVQCILQDRRGFIWFGTYEGLNRYDGYHFKIYKFAIDNPNSLCNNTIRSILEDHNGILWVGTNDGLEQYDQQKDGFIHYKHDPLNSNSLSSNRIRWLHEDQSGTLWIGTYGGGLNALDRERKNITRYLHHAQDPKSLISNNITCVHTDRQGTLWIATDGGLDRFDGEKKQFIHYQHNPLNPGSISGNDVYRIYEDRTGILWFGIWNGGLDQFDPGKNQFHHIRKKSGDPYSLSNDIVRCFYDDRDGSLWMGTWGGGINIYDRKKKQFVSYQSDQNDPRSLSNNSILTIYEDRSGIIWVGNDYGGINKYDRGKMKFVHYKKNLNNANTLSANTIYALVETHDRGNNILWIGTHAGGLNKFDLNTKSFTHFLSDPHNPHSLIDNNVRSLILDRNGGLWIGTNKGLNYFDRVKETFTNYMPSPTVYGLNNNDVFSLCADKGGLIWIGSYGRGLYKFDPREKKFTNYITDPENPHSISDNFIWSIFEDRAGILWIGTENGGLNKLDREKNQFIHYETDPHDVHSLSGNKILCIQEDRTGMLWIGTTNGLNRFDRIKNQFSRYMEADGLPSNAIQSILEDDHKNLWIGTLKGLSKFDMERNTFRNFKISDGLQSNEFGVNACVRNQDGEMFFGGNNGFNSFFPDSIVINSYIPPIVIEDFKIFNTSVSVGKEIHGRVILDKAITETNEIHLSYRDNGFSFDFASLNFASPEENKYAYFMEGFDTKWNYTDASRRFAFYNNMSGGEYTFHVKGSNNDGTWNETGASIRIIITPPFWKTVWFYTLLGLGCISLAASIYRYRMYRVRLNEWNLQKKVDERTQELAREVREHRKAEEALVLQDTAIQSAANAIVITDRNGVVISVNRAFCKLTGYAQEEVIGRKTNILKSGRQPQIIYKKMWETILAGNVWNGEIENRRKDGSLYIEDMTITPVRQAGGEISHFIAIKQDITEHKRLQDQLLQSQKIQSMGTLAGGIAHDFNNILNIILGYSSHLEKSYAQPARFKESIQAISHAVDRGTSLVRQILTFARKTEIKFEPVNIQDLIHELFSMMRQTFPKIITFHEMLDPDLPYLLADYSQMHQVILNLCINARDAMPDGGSITITAEKQTKEQVQHRCPTAHEDMYMCITVTDTGEGMDEAIRQRIFDPFFTTKEQGKGTGLGLAVVYGVVHTHHGLIDATSERGKGTTFRLYFPLDSTAVSRADVPVHTVSVDLSGTETVLLVEDEIDIITMLRLSLVSKGYKVYTAHDGKEALSEYEKHREEIDIVLSDMGLPGMIGKDVFKHLRAINPDLKIILISGFFDPEVKSVLDKEGVNGFIQKPYSAPAVLQKIREVLDGK
jgi:PAS domain S-box-containing protein